MAYVRTKWINGYPYLYLQESYRENGKVKTRTLEYLGQGGGKGAGGGSSGIQSAKFDYSNHEISKLQYFEEYAEEAGLLAGYIHRNDVPMRVATDIECLVGNVQMGESHQAYLLASSDPINGEYLLLPNSSPITWMHTVGSLLQESGTVVSEKISKEIDEYVNTAQILFSEVVQGSIAKAKKFVTTYGDYVDIRQLFSLNDKQSSTDALLYDKSELSQILQQVENKTLEPESFIQAFRAWVVPNYNFSSREVFSNAFASLAVDAKYATDCFGKEGKKILTVMYPVIHVAFEEFQYVLTGRRPRKRKSRRKYRRRTISKPTYKPHMMWNSWDRKMMFSPGRIELSDAASDALFRPENSQRNSMYMELMYRHTTLAHVRGWKNKLRFVGEMNRRGEPIQSVLQLADGTVLEALTHEGRTNINIL